jgi:protein TonB
MIARALLISLALHLAVLVSAAPGLPGRNEGDQWGRRGIVANLRGTGAVQEARFFASTKERRSDRRVASARKSAEIEPIRAGRFSEIASFFGPTVAFESHGRSGDPKTRGEDASEAFLSAGDGEREYRLNLAREARRFKRHPSGIDGREAEGVVVVAVSMRVAELPPEIRLHQSSGDEALDRSALEMMERAVKTARIPLELQGRRFRIAVPVEYRLAD